MVTNTEKAQKAKAAIFGAFGSYWTTINRRMLKKDTPCPKTKKKPQWDGRRDEITIKSNSIPAGWVTHKLENSKTKEVLPLLWRFWTPHQASPYGDLTKELGIHKEYGHEGQRHPHCGRILYQLSHEESLRILEWVAYPFSSRSSWPRNQTGDSCIAGGFFTSWATMEALGVSIPYYKLPIVI